MEKTNKQRMHLCELKQLDVKNAQEILENRESLLKLEVNTFFFKYLL